MGARKRANQRAQRARLLTAAQLPTPTLAGFCGATRRKAKADQLKLVQLAHVTELVQLWPSYGLPRPAVVPEPSNCV